MSAPPQPSDHHQQLLERGFTESELKHALSTSSTNLLAFEQNIIDFIKNTIKKKYRQMRISELRSLLETDASYSKEETSKFENTDRDKMADILTTNEIKSQMSSEDREKLLLLVQQQQSSAAANENNKANTNQQKDEAEEKQQQQEQLFCNHTEPLAMMLDQKSKQNWHISTQQERELTQKIRDEQFETVWKKHPRYKSNARHFIEDVHGHFRASFNAIASDAEKFGVNKKLFLARIEELEGHHTGEDNEMFPYLMRKYPETVRAFAYLSKDHKALDPLEKKVVEEKSAEATIEFSAFLHDHLNREELLVIPLFLQQDYGI